MIGLLVVTSPAQEPPALVLGKPVQVRGVITGGVVTRDQWKAVAAEIQSALMAYYARTHRLEPTAAEIASVRERMRRTTGNRVATIDESAELLRQDLIRNGVDEQTAAQQARDFAARHAARDQQFVISLIQLWKVGGALFAQYGGGRVRLSAFGFHEPIDAMERFLIDEERRGNFSIPDPRTRAILWSIFQDKSGGDGVVSGAKAEAIYAKPLWEQPM